MDFVFSFRGWSIKRTKEMLRIKRLVLTLKLAYVQTIFRDNNASKEGEKITENNNKAWWHRMLSDHEKKASRAKSRERNRHTFL